jgi:hypothetical protein
MTQTTEGHIFLALVIECVCIIQEMELD